MGNLWYTFVYHVLQYLLSDVYSLKKKSFAKMGKWEICEEQILAAVLSFKSNRWKASTILRSIFFCNFFNFPNLTLQATENPSDSHFILSLLVTTIISIAMVISCHFQNLNLSAGEIFQQSRQQVKYFNYHSSRWNISTISRWNISTICRWNISTITAAGEIFQLLAGEIFQQSAGEIFQRSRQQVKYMLSPMKRFNFSDGSTAYQELCFVFWHF